MANQLSTRVELYLHADQTTHQLLSVSPKCCRLAEPATISDQCVRIETVIDGKSRFYDAVIQKQVGRMVYFNFLRKLNPPAT